MKNSVVIPKIPPNTTTEDYEKKVIGIIKANPTLKIDQIIIALSENNGKHASDCELQAGFIFLRLWASGRLMINHRREIEIR